MSSTPNGSTKGKRRCRRSCPTLIPRHLAFCKDCWAKIPYKIRRRILSSWAQVRRNDDDLDAYGAHAEMLLNVDEALDGGQPWEALS